MNNSLIKRIVFSILKNIMTFSSFLKGKKLLILIYHRVLDEPDPMRPGEVYKQKFNWQMKLVANYFNILPLTDALERLKEDDLPSRAICITFDDGYADNYLNALPILLKNELTATFYIASSFLDGGCMWNDIVIEAIRSNKNSHLDLEKINLGLFDISTEAKKSDVALQVIREIRYLEPSKRIKCTELIAVQAESIPDNLMLTSLQLKKLKQSGMEIGGHTLTHPILAKLDYSKAYEEILQNKKNLETMLNTTLKSFAYPNGIPGQDFLPEHVNIVRETGYQAAVSTSWGITHQNSDIFQLPRFTPWDKTPLRFMARLSYNYVLCKKNTI